MLRIAIHLHVNTARSVRAAADLVATALDRGDLARTADLIRHADGVTYVVRRYEDRIEVRESESAMVVAETE